MVVQLLFQIFCVSISIASVLVRLSCSHLPFTHVLTLVRNGDCWVTMLLALDVSEQECLLLVLESMMSCDFL